MNLSPNMQMCLLQEIFAFWKFCTHTKFMIPMKKYRKESSYEYYVWYSLIVYSLYLLYFSAFSSLI